MFPAFMTFFGLIELVGLNWGVLGKWRAVNKVS